MHIFYVMFHVRCALLYQYQVSQLVAQLFQMRVRMKNLMGVMEGGSIPALSNLEDALKSEQKVHNLLCLTCLYIYILSECGSKCGWTKQYNFI